MLKLNKDKSNSPKLSTVSNALNKPRRKVFLGFLIGAFLLLVYPAAQALHPIDKTMHKEVKKHSITLSVKANTTNQVSNQQNSQPSTSSGNSAKSSNSASVNVSSTATQNTASSSQNTSCSSTIIVNGQVVNSGNCGNYSQDIPNTNGGQTNVNVQQNSNSSNSASNNSSENIQVNSDSSSDN